MMSWLPSSDVESCGAMNELMRDVAQEVMAERPPFIPSDGMSVVMTSQSVEKISGDDWMTVGVDRVWWSGQHSFTVRVIKSVWYVSVGVMSADLTSCTGCLGWTGESVRGWGYNSDGYKFHNGSGPRYGERYYTGDVIRCDVDMDKRTITFFKNDISQGIAYTDFEGPLRPVVSLLKKGEKIQLLTLT